MTNKTGKIAGFIIGVSSFLFLFKILLLDHIPPEDEVPPGVVVFAAVLNGFLLAFVGHLVQDYMTRNKRAR
jgi:hypothetical protein